MVRIPEILFHYQFNDIARICAVTVKTARNWKTGKVFPPAAAIKLLTRDLGCFHPAWNGWVISARGELCSPENWVATPGDVRAQQFHHTLTAALREEILILKSQLKSEEVQRYEEQPLPDQWEWITAEA